MTNYPVKLLKLLKIENIVNLLIISVTNLII